MKFEAISVCAFIALASNFCAYPSQAEEPSSLSSDIHLEAKQEQPGKIEFVVSVRNTTGTPYRIYTADNWQPILALRSGTQLGGIVRDVTIPIGEANFPMVAAQGSYRFSIGGTLTFDKDNEFVIELSDLRGGTWTFPPFSDTSFFLSIAPKSFAASQLSVTELPGAHIDVGTIADVAPTQWIRMAIKRKNGQLWLEEVNAAR